MCHQQRVELTSLSIDPAGTHERLAELFPLATCKTHGPDLQVRACFLCLTLAKKKERALLQITDKDFLSPASAKESKPLTSSTWNTVINDRSPPLLFSTFKKGWQPLVRFSARCRQSAAAPYTVSAKYVIESGCGSTPTARRRGDARHASNLCGMWQQSVAAILVQQSDRLTGRFCGNELRGAARDGHGEI